MKIEIRPHGRTAERRFQALSAQGVPWSEASRNASSVEIWWPDNWRLPATGDSLYLEEIDISGPVERTTFTLDVKGEWSVSVKLG